MTQIRDYLVGKVRKVKYGAGNVNLNFKIENDSVLVLWNFSGFWCNSLELRRKRIKFKNILKNSVIVKEKRIGSGSRREIILII